MKLTLIIRLFDLIIRLFDYDEKLKNNNKTKKINFKKEGWLFWKSMENRRREKSEFIINNYQIE